MAEGAIRPQTAIPLLLLAIVAFTVYSPSTTAPYYGDDFEFVFDESAPIYSHLFRDNPVNGFYRPIQSIFMALVQRLWGLDPAPIHLVQVLFHFFVSCIVFLTIRGMKYSTLQAILGSLFMLVSQANAHAVLSNDTLSQTSGTLFGFMAVVLTLQRPTEAKILEDSNQIRRSTFPLILLALFLSLFSKECGVAYSIMIVGVYAARFRGMSRGSVVRHLLGRIVPVLIVVSSYVVVRCFVAGLQPQFGSGGYDFYLGMNIIRNNVLCIGAAAVPLSSVDAFSAYRTGEIFSLSVVVGLTAVFLATVVFGLVLSRQHCRRILLFTAFFFIGLWPMVLMNHVSELYVYNSMPFFSVLVGVGLGNVLEYIKEKRVVYVGFWIALILLFSSHIFAVRGKARMMRTNGERAAVLLRGIERYVGCVPEGGRLVLVNPPTGGHQYSIFRVNGFNVLRNGLHRIHQTSHRTDFGIEIIDVKTAAEEGAVPDTFSVTACPSDGWAVREFRRMP